MGAERVLAVNAGSSSLKLRVLEDDEAVWSRDASPGDPRAFDSLPSGIDAIGHRIVHGGRDLAGPVLIDEGTEARIRALADLAPLHQSAGIAGIDATREALPGVPAVACFDTAFHATLPPGAAVYAVPHEWRERWGVRRYGFHGLSHQYAAGRAAGLVGRDVSSLRVVTCHLGAGASLCAVRGGRSVDTTMGFTPLEGLAMATRSGTVDPGAVLWLQQRAGVPAADVADALEHRSGMLALAGTADMRRVLEAAGDGDAGARLAVDVYLHRLRAGVAAMAAAMGGLDALVFTGGVGENAPEVRGGAAEGLGFLGVLIDPARNRGAGDRDISAGPAAVRTLVVEAREDVEIAREVRRVLPRSGPDRYTHT